MENVACVLRNLSYRLENEIDPQEGADDVLDREWEMEQRREIEELDRSFAKAAPGCFAFLTRPRRRDNALRLNTPAALNRPMYNIDFANPGKINGCGQNLYIVHVILCQFELSMIICTL